MQDIPLIDISACNGSHAFPILDEVEQACSEIGFMYVAGHGITPATFAAVREAVAGYFSQPLATKLQRRISRDNYRGYIPAGFFSANSGELEADGYEGYKLHQEVAAGDPVCTACDLYGPNIWPQEPAGLRQAVLDYWQACDRVANILLNILAQLLGVDKSSFQQLFDKPLTNMTLLHYPPREQGYGIHPHKDTDVFTILAPDPVGGLMVKRKGRAGWINAEAPGDALVVNTGDMLELWSGGRFVSTPHKVLSPGTRSRYSFPYFVVPRYDTVVAPLVPVQPNFSRSSVHVGDVSREVWRTNWPDAQPSETGFELGTLED